MCIRDRDLHVGLLAEDELTRLAEVIHRIAERLEVPLDQATVAEVEKTVDPDQVLDALGSSEGDPKTGGHGAGAPSAMKDSTAS